MSEPVVLHKRGHCLQIQWVRYSYDLLEDLTKWWHSCDICTARGTPLVWFDMCAGEGVQLRLCLLCLRDIVGDVEILEDK